MELRQRGYLGLEGRAFFVPPKYSGQQQGSGPSSVMEPDFALQSENESHTITLRPFLRFDPQDTARTHFDLREFDYAYAAHGWEFGVGTRLFTWGVLEGNHMVDVVNQIDLVENLDRRQKLGAPYVRLAKSFGDVDLQALYLPYQRAETFPGVRGRLRAPLVIDSANPLYASELGPWHPTFAVRAAFHLGEVDLGVTGFSGLSREPTFVAQFTNSTVVPLYDFLQQTGIDLQWTHEAFALKAEAAARWWSNAYRFAWALGTGVEYTFFDLGGGGADLTLVLEHYLDQRPLDTPFTVLQNDVFAGGRLAFNDEAGLEFRAGSVTDVERGTTFVSLEARRRFGEHWTIAIQGRAYLVPSPVLESAFERDHYLQAQIFYHL